MVIIFDLPIKIMIIIYTVIDKFEEAENIAQTLISEKLVACVNMWPINSMYMSNKKLLKVNETGVFLKTSASSQEAVYQRLLELHPYECPAIITMNINQAHPAFAHWVQEQTH